MSANVKRSLRVATTQIPSCLARPLRLTLLHKASRMRFPLELRDALSKTEEIRSGAAAEEHFRGYRGGRIGLPVLLAVVAALVRSLIAKGGTNYLPLWLPTAF